MDFPIKKVAKLARIDITEEEEKKISEELASVIGYISELEKIPVGELDFTAIALLENIMIEDVGAHESGAFTDAILADVPRTRDGFVVVKKVLIK